MWIPWQGQNYQARRLLLLGESCYSWRENGQLIHPQPDHPVMLSEWAMAEPNTAIAFLRKLTRALCDVEAPTDEQAQVAWQSVAFTNYVPVAVGEGHAANANAAAWAQAASELPDLLNLLSPRVVIVLGRTMWSRMPETQVNLGDYVQGYTLENGETAMCHVIAHPSRGPSWTEYADRQLGAILATSSGCDLTAISKPRSAGLVISSSSSSPTLTRSNRPITVQRGCYVRPSFSESDQRLPRNVGYRGRSRHPYPRRYRAPHRYQPHRHHPQQCRHLEATSTKMSRFDIDSSIRQNL